MYIVACYRIFDSEAFRARTQGPLRDRPLHWRLISALPTRDGRACFSLWWADSVEALQRVLARAAGSAGSVECHEVDDDNAMGLVETPVTVIHVARGGAE